MLMISIKVFHPELKAPLPAAEASFISIKALA
jgi:hypothetical protein